MPRKRGPRRRFFISRQGQVAHRGRGRFRAPMRLLDAKLSVTRKGRGTKTVCRRPSWRKAPTLLVAGLRSDGGGRGGGEAP